MNETQGKAPALENGLDMLELVSDGPCGFNDLVEALDMSRGSVARLSKIMIARGYLERNHQGKYVLGPAVSGLLDGDNVKRRLIDVAKPVMITLTSITSCSTILFHWDGYGFESLDKESDEQGPAMQELGTISTDLSRYPWGWLVYETMTKEAKLKARERMRKPKLVDRGLKLNDQWIKKYGVAYDDQVVDRYQRRLAILLRRRDSKIIGALGLGGNPLIMPDEDIQELAMHLNFGKTEIEQKLI